MILNNRPGKNIKTIFLNTLAAALLVFVAVADIHAHGELADSHAQHNAVAASESDMAMARIDLPDSLSMLNQFGDKVDLRKDVIGDKIVVIDFVYTTCTTVCPVVSSILSMVQKHFGDQMDKDVVLISITVDPARDTPHRLLSYSKNFNLGSGWSWLTGDKKSVDKALSALGAYTPNFEDHPAMMLIGDDSKSEWYRYYGFPAPAAIETKVKDLLAKRTS